MTKEDKIFIEACRQGNTNEVKDMLLLKMGNPQINKNTPLREACENKHTEIVKVLLKEGADPNCENGYPLQSACANGDYETAKALIKAGSDPNRMPPEGSPLKWAVINKNSNLVKLLIKAAANIHAENDIAIKISSSISNEEITKLLIIEGDYEKKNPQLAFQALCCIGEVEKARLLLTPKNGINPKENQNAILTVAARNGHLEVVKLLLELGADPTAKSDNILIQTSKMGFEAIVTSLLKAYPTKELNRLRAETATRKELPEDLIFEEISNRMKNMHALEISKSY